METPETNDAAQDFAEQDGGTETPAKKEPAKKAKAKAKPKAVKTKSEIKEFDGLEIAPADQGVYHLGLYKKIKVGNEEVNVEKKVQTFKPAAFAQFKGQAARLGLTIEVLHEPKK